MSNAPGIRFIDTPEGFASLLGELGRPTRLAIDTEAASYHRYSDRICLLQLSTATVTAVVDTLRVPDLAAFGALLTDPSVESVFHDADYDLRLLHQDYGWRITNIFDTRVAAQLLGLTSFGLAALLERYFGLKLDKKHQRADWSMRPLTDDMLDYAAHDTRHLLELRDLLRNELERKGRWAWAAEEFLRLEGTKWEPDAADTAFLRMKGARDLTRRELARLKELVIWRDSIARQLDRSTFRVMANEVLFEVARTSGTTKEQLSAIKGMPRGILERQSAEIIAAVAAGDAVAEADLPRFARSARWDKDPEFDPKVSALKTVRDEAAKRLELDPGVLCSRDRLEAVARRGPRSVEEVDEVKELRRWQAAEMGAEFVKALKPFANRPAKEAASTQLEIESADAVPVSALPDSASTGAAVPAAASPTAGAPASRTPKRRDDSPYKDS